MGTLRTSLLRCAICTPVSLLARAQISHRVVLSALETPSLISCSVSTATSWRCASSWAPISSTLCYIALLTRNREADATLERGLVAPSPSACECDPKQVTDTVGRPCRHCSKEQLPEPRGECVPTREERDGSPNQ